MRSLGIALLLCALCTLILVRFRYHNHLHTESRRRYATQADEDSSTDLIDAALADLHPQQDKATPLHIPLKPFDASDGRQHVRSKSGARPARPAKRASTVHADDFDPFVSDLEAQQLGTDQQGSAGDDRRGVVRETSADEAPQRRSWSRGRRSRTQSQPASSSQKTQHDNTKAIITNTKPRAKQTPQQKPNKKSFRTIGMEIDVQRVTSHDFAPIYERYLATRRDEPRLRLLEIGLGQGCESPGLPIGDSLKLWQQYLPKATVSFLEVDQQCAKQLGALPNGGTLYIGDQADAGVLQQVARVVCFVGGVVEHGLCASWGCVTHGGRGSS